MGTPKKKDTRDKTKTKSKSKSKKGLRNPAALSIMDKGSKAVSTTNANTGNALSWITIAAAGMGLYLVYKAVNNIGKGVDKLGDAFTGEEPGAGGGNPLPNNPDTPPTGATITLNQAQTIAASLLAAMNSIGTDTDTIFALLNNKTPRDYALISTAFGQKRYGVFGEGSWPQPLRDLTYWLNAELSAKEMTKLRTLMPGVF